MHFNGFLRRGFIAAYYFRDYITTNLRLAASRNIPAPATLGDPRRFSGASMVPPKEEPEEGMTQEELNAAAADTTTIAPSEPRKKNAFSELMAPKPKPAAAKPPSSSTSRNAGSAVGRRFQGRDGLGAYLADPSSFPPGRVIYHSDSFVAVHDLFPKATVHALLLPRAPSRTLLHPFDAFEDAEFLRACVRETEVLKGFAARELQRLLGGGSGAERRRQDVLDGKAEVGDGEDVDESGLPRGRDWGKEIVAGVHAVPSMSNLHIHVLSRDMRSPALKHRKHYNSFATGFFVPLEAFPLAADDERRRTGEAGFLRGDFECWRCGRGFGNRFAELKAHLEVEFEEWRRE